MQGSKNFLKDDLQRSEDIMRMSVTMEGRKESLAGGRSAEGQTEIIIIMKINPSSE